MSPTTNGLACGCTALPSGITVAPSRAAATCRTLAESRSICAVASTGVSSRASDGPRYTRICRSERPAGSAALFASSAERDDDDGRRDADSERHCGERRAGTRLIAGQVSQRQTRHDRKPPGQGGEGPDASGPRRRLPRIVARSPATMKSGLSRLDNAREPMPTAISAAAAKAEWRAGRGLGAAPRARA